MGEQTEPLHPAIGAQSSKRILGGGARRHGPGTGDELGPAPPLHLVDGGGPGDGGAVWPLRPRPPPDLRLRLRPLAVLGRLPGGSAPPPPPTPRVPGPISLPRTHRPVRWEGQPATDGKGDFASGRQVVLLRVNQEVQAKKAAMDKQSARARPGEFLSGCPVQVDQEPSFPATHSHTTFEGCPSPGGQCGERGLTDSGPRQCAGQGRRRFVGWPGLGEAGSPSGSAPCHPSGNPPCSPFPLNFNVSAPQVTT